MVGVRSLELGLVDLPGHRTAGAVPRVLGPPRGIAHQRVEEHGLVLGVSDLFGYSSAHRQLRPYGPCLLEGIVRKKIDVSDEKHNKAYGCEVTEVGARSWLKRGEGMSMFAKWAA